MIIFIIILLAIIYILSQGLVTKKFSNCSSFKDFYRTLKQYNEEVNIKILDKLQEIYQVKLYKIEKMDVYVIDNFIDPASGCSYNNTVSVPKGEKHSGKYQGTENRIVYNTKNIKELYGKYFLRINQIAQEIYNRMV